MKNIVILSIVQGICEWFPVSSSGHLFLLQKILGLNPDINLEIFLHFSSLFVMVIFFRTRLKELIKGFFSFQKDRYEFKFSIYVICATLITAIIGFFMKDASFLNNKWVISSGFLFTTIFLFLSDRKGERKITIKDSFIIGFFQGISLIPGISRSGSTISISKICKINDRDAFEFSFIIAIPAISGAILIKLKEIRMINPAYLLTGFFISFFTGLFSLFILKKIFLNYKFKYFGFYTLFLFLLSLFIP